MDEYRKRQLDELRKLKGFFEKCNESGKENKKQDLLVVVILYFLVMQFNIILLIFLIQQCV